MVAWTARAGVQAVLHATACRRYDRRAVFETFFAALVVAVCVVLFVRLLMGETRRWRFDAALRRGAERIRRFFTRTGRGAREMAARPGAERRARRAADDAIRRAQQGSWDGNVFRPKAFGQRRADKKNDKPRRDLH